VPPEPYHPYVIPGLKFEATEVRGNGTNLGQIVVNPYFFVIGQVYDRATLAPVRNVDVTMIRLSGGSFRDDTATFVSDIGGQFSFAPHIKTLGPVTAKFVLDAPGYSRPFTVERVIPPNFHDAETTIIRLPLGWGFAYSGGTRRRGNYLAIPGVHVEFARISGIHTQPQQRLLPVDVNGSFPFKVKPLEEGTLQAEIRVLPPAPFPPETTVVTVSTTDDDVVQSLGFFNYGAQLAFTGTVLFDDDDTPVPPGSVADFQDLTGVSLDLPAPSADTTTAIGTDGVFRFQGAAADSGTAHFDLIVRMPAPYQWDTIPGMAVAARYSDSTVMLGPLHVRRRLRP